ncbi:MAG TPA: TIGR03085 family metal-binding protein [Pseudonocardiaceae bacterium]|jgi:uncharacterized protein (TIGR03085 family)|nr:TIGR03085 family metal-binding protein [Pseudonocardiaceae bacterium]
MGLASEERSGLCATLTEVGPDAPTLCEGWQTKDLAAHLVARDRRPDILPGMIVPAFAGHTQKVQDQYAALPWDKLVDLVRTGPPRLSPMSIPQLNELANGAEYFVHHEDVRRAQPDWTPRPAQAQRDEALWKVVRRMGRLVYRRSPVGVALKRPDGETVVANRGPRTVTLSGEPGDLLFFTFGRSAVRLDFDGEEDAVSAVQNLKRGM